MKIRPTFKDIFFTFCFFFFIILFFTINIFGGILFLLLFFLHLFYILNRTLYCQGNFGQPPYSIPDNRFKATIQLNSVISDLQNSGYEDFDKFYLRNLVPTTVFILKHNSNSSYLYLSCWNGEFDTTVYTFFKDGYILLTTSVERAVALPRDGKEYLEVFPEKRKSELMEIHNMNVETLSAMGLTVIEPDIDDVRNTLQKSYLNSICLLKRNIFPLAFEVFRAFIYCGRQNKITVKQQFEEGIAKL